METAVKPFIKREGLNWVTITAFTVFHIGAIFALMNFTWSGLIAAALLYWISLSFGIGMGYHRLLTHRSYKVPKWFEYFLAVCGTLALEGGPIFWVATHRVHHQFSDKDGDPHTPHDGKWWAHILWMMVGENTHCDIKACGKYAPDMIKDRFHMWLSTYHYVPLIVVGLILFAIGGLNMVLWGVFLRVTLGLHATWLVNSATHLWGKQRFNSRDDSKNNWWVAAATFGEGWHNNHHAFPASARHGLAWYEIDITWMTIKMFEKLGIATAVREASLPEEVEAPAKAA